MMQLEPGILFKITGYIPPLAKEFHINVGKDELNLGLHFNPRFNYYNDQKVIFYNSKVKDQWGEEQRDHHFPYSDLSTVEVSIMFEEKEFRIRLHDGYDLTFPNRLNLKEINYIAVEGDFCVRKVDFK
ncbi:galectin-1-like [Sminthopsis crassicaudata]|uniref:galectin-1-like n=1 Tax=Sminthopsis crassicaudata TaxID=9301 RepID=UPI003D684F5E